MVEQQELKSYKLLSSQSVVVLDPNDKRWEDMWYIVSVTVHVFLKAKVIITKGAQVKSQGGPDHEDSFNLSKTTAAMCCSDICTPPMKGFSDSLHPLWKFC